MINQLSFGEYVRHLRRRKSWGLQDLAGATGLSVSHLSRLENDNVVPIPGTVVKLATALDGELERMLALADCLPREILDRLVRRAGDVGSGVQRRAGAQADAGFAHALIEEMDPSLRSALMKRFELSEQDIAGLFSLLQRIASMPSDQRENVIKFLAATAPKENE